MKKALTVNQLVERLTELQKQGKGDAEVIVIPIQAPITGVYGPVGISNAEVDAVMLYAKPATSA